MFGYSYGLPLRLPVLKPLFWVGSARKDLAAMPCEVKQVVGHALFLAQTGQRHAQAKPLSGWHGCGVLEVVEDHCGEAYRAVYTVRYTRCVYAVHCFHKKSKRGIATPRPDLDVIEARLKAVAAREKE